MAVDVSMTALGGLLKQVYMGPLNKAIGERVLLWNELNTIGMKRMKVVGDRVYWSVLLRGAKGVGFRGNNEFLPVGQPNVSDQASAQASKFYATLDISKFTMHIAGPSSSSFADYLALQMQLIQDEAAFHLNRSLHGDGSGALATVTTTDPYAIGADIALTHVNSYAFGATQFIEDKDLTVAFINPTSFAVSGVGKITDINWDNGTIQLDTAVNLTAGDQVVLGDSFGHSGGTREFVGLRGIIKNTGDVFGLSTTEYRRWNSRILNTSVTEVPYNWDQIYRMVKTTMSRGGKSPVVLMHPAISREHRRLYESDVRYAPVNIDFSKGQKVPAINVDGKMIRIIEDPYLGFQEMLCIETGDLFKNVIKELSIDTDGGGKLKQVSGKDSLWMYMSAYMNLGATALNRFARFDGVKVSTDYVADLHKDI